MLLSLDTVWRRWWRTTERATEPPRAGEAAEFKPPGESPWLAHLDRFHIPRHLAYPSTTLGRILDQTADRFGANQALLYNQHHWTYRELLADVNRMAAGLASLGVRRGERVLLALPNCPEMVIGFLAIQKLGAVAVNAGPLMGHDDLETVVSMTSPRVVLCLDLQAASLHAACQGSTVEHLVYVSLQNYQPVLKWLGYQIKLWQNRDASGGARHILLGDLLARAPAAPPTSQADPANVAVLQATGGTTGTLKLAQLTHRNLLANAMQISVWQTARLGQERCLAVLPMFHVYGLTLCLIASIFTGAAIILMTRFDAAEMLEILRRHKPTICPIVPTICDAISDLLEKERKADAPATAMLSGLRLCVSGAAPLPHETAERFKCLTGATVIEGYGLTEASPVTHAGMPNDVRPGSIGFPMPDTRVRIVDPDDPTRQAPPGEPGELLISGPQIMTGYFANPEQTHNVLLTDARGDTWLRTGDIGRMDGDGYFYILDRKKDMIIRSGLKVFPGKVERVLRLHKSARDVAVIGRPDPHQTEMVVAVIAPAPPVEEQARLADELRALCREHLASYEVPQRFEFMDQLPRSALGKLLKRQLRKTAPAVGVSGDGAASPGEMLVDAPLPGADALIEQQAPSNGSAPRPSPALEFAAISDHVGTHSGDGSNPLHRSVGGESSKLPQGPTPTASPFRGGNGNAGLVASGDQ